LPYIFNKNINVTCMILCYSYFYIASHKGVLLLTEFEKRKKKGKEVQEYTSSK